MARLERDNPVSLNRTRMELKLGSPPETYTRECQFESHQNGIEIVNCVIGRRFVFWFESHQNGIEICVDALAGCEKVLFESHQNGIETALTPVMLADVAWFESHQNGIEIRNICPGQNDEPPV